LFYIYVIALYFLYSNQNRVEKYEDDYELEEHPIHDHLLDKQDRELPEGFKTWAEVVTDILPLCVSMQVNFDTVVIWKCLVWYCFFV